MYEALRSHFSSLVSSVCISNARRKSVRVVVACVCRKNLFFSLYACVKISIFSVEIFLQNIRENGRTYHL